MNSNKCKFNGHISQDNMGKLVSEYQTILEYAAVRDNGRGAVMEWQLY